MTEEKLLTMQEAARLLGVSMPTIYAIVDTRKELAPVEERRIGKQRRRFFRRSDVERLKQERAGEDV